MTLRLSGASEVDRSGDGGVRDATMIDAIPAANRRPASASHVVGETEPRLEIVLIGWKALRLLRAEDRASNVWQWVGHLWLGELLVLVSQTEVQREAR